MRNHRPLAVFSLAILLFASAAFGADPRLMNLVMPDATTLAGANVANAKNTPFGQFVLNQMTSAMNQQLQAFVAATGFDPRQDVTEILAASSGTAKNPSGLVLALGNFQVSQMAAAAAAKSPQLTVQTYGGATLISGGTGAGAYSVAFFGSTIAAAGDTASVKAAVDRSTGVNSVAPALAAQVQSLSAANDAWAVTTTPASALLAGLTGPASAPSASGAGSGSTPSGATGAASSPAAGVPGLGMLSQVGQLFNGIQGSSGGVVFGSTVQITGQAVTTDAATAKSLADVLTALAAIAAMGTGQNPQLASLAQMLQGLKVTADGASVNLALSVPEAQLESFLNSLKQPAVKPAARPALRPAVLALPR